MLTMIFACDRNGAIGKDGDLPWHQSSDLQHFKRITMRKTVVMGRKTWDSLPFKNGLPNRRNIVMTRTARDDVEVMSFEEVLALSEEEEVCIIGGGEIYALFLEHAKEIHRTIVDTRVEGADTFAPDIAGMGCHLMGERHVAPGPRDDHAMTFQHWLC